MQGTAADLIKLAMVQVHDQLTAGGFQSRLLLQVHDELILEVPEHELGAVRAMVPSVMEQVAQMRVPLLVSVGVGMNWDDAH
jgi:DNA polymerase-1